MDIVINKKTLEVKPTCISCDACLIICPEKSIFTDGKEYVIDNFSCTLCNICVQICPVNAIKETIIPDSIDLFEK